MKKYLFIGMGGFIGAVLRFYLKGISSNNYSEIIPLNTLLINITGCFILGMFLTLALEVWEIDTSFRLGIATGLLGALTTFSTLCKESYLLILKGEYYLAITYLAVSTMLGIIAVYLGTTVVRKVISD